MTPFIRASNVLKQVLGSARSSFYRDFYKENGGVPQTPATYDAWAKLPLISKSDIVKVPFTDRIFAPMSDINTIRFTSGTSGKGILITPRPNPPIPFDGQQIYRGSSLISFFYNVHSIACLRGTTAQRITAGDQRNLRLSAVLASQANVDSLLGSGSILMEFGEHLSRYALNRRIRNITLTAEPVSILQRNALAAWYPNASVFNAYGLQEIGTIAYTPSDVPTELVEVLPSFYAELLNEQGSRPLEDIKEEVEGELILTTLRDGEPFPFIRYRTGDSARTKLTGEKTLLEILGRVDDTIRIPGGQLVQTEVERTIGIACGKMAVDFELTVLEKKIGGALKTAVSLRIFFKGVAPPHEAGERLASTLRVNSTKTYADGVAEGIYLPLSVTFSEFEASAGKRIRLKDTRI